MTQRCPNRSQPLPPRSTGVQTHRTPRPGGRQVSMERAVRILAWALLDEQHVSDEARAQRLARRWLTRALPAKQRAPRKQPADVGRAA